MKKDEGRKEGKKGEVSRKEGRKEGRRVRGRKEDEERMGGRTDGTKEYFRPTMRSSSGSKYARHLPA
jgi:hypothetical protein